MPERLHSYGHKTRVLRSREKDRHMFISDSHGDAWVGSYDHLSQHHATKVSFQLVCRKQVRCHIPRMQSPQQFLYCNEEVAKGVSVLGIF